MFFLSFGSDWSGKGTNVKNCVIGEGSYTN